MFADARDSIPKMRKKKKTYRTFKAYKDDRDRRDIAFAAKQKIVQIFTNNTFRKPFIESAPDRTSLSGRNDESTARLEIIDS